MFQTVKKWADEHPRRHELERLLSSESVRVGKNHVVRGNKSRGFDDGCHGGHGKVSGSLWSQVHTRDLNAMEGKDGNPAKDYISDTPAPPQKHDFGQNADYMNYDRAGGQQQGLQPGPGGPGNYNAPTPQPNQYYGGYGGDAPPPPQGGYQQGYGGQQQPPYQQGYNQGYGGPPPPQGQWGGGYQGGPPPPQGYQGGPPPPGGYGGPGYEGQGQGGYNQYPGQGQGQGQGWNQYGQGGGY